VGVARGLRHKPDDVRFVGPGVTNLLWMLRWMGPLRHVVPRLELVDGAEPLCSSLHAAKLSSDKIKLTAPTLFLDTILPDVSTGI
jgi:hypothetical protein